MKSNISKIGTAGRCVIACVCSVALLFGQAAKAAQTSLNVTNYIVAGANGTFTSFPTNVFNPTNGCAASTGGAVDISHNTEFSLSVLGTLNNTNGTAYYLTVYLVRSLANNTPQISTTNIEWETSPQPQLSYQITLPASQTNVPICWVTNFPDAFVGAADYIGVYLISNNLANTSWITNFQMNIGKKITRTILTTQ